MILKLMPISAFLVYKGFDANLYTITIYRRIKNLENLAKPAIQALLTFLRGCMTRRLVNDTGNFILSSVSMESIPPAVCKWGLNKFSITFQLYAPHVKSQIQLQLHLRHLQISI